MLDGDLLALAASLIRRFPDTSEALIAEISRAPTEATLLYAADRLLEAGELDGAETIYRFFSGRSEAGPWARIGLAKIAGARGDAKAGAAEWQVCLRQFEGVAEPFWYAELSRAEREVGDRIGAERTLRQCIRRFPQFAAAYAALANLLSTPDRLDEAADLWFAAIRDFSTQAEIWWFGGLANSLRKLGRTSEEDLLLNDMSERFPSSVVPIVQKAFSAEHRGDWAKALELWEECLRFHADGPNPVWFNRRAMALFRLWRIDEALDGWSSLIDRFPDCIEAYLGLATAAKELGRWKVAETCFTELISRFPERLNVEWIAERAYCLLQKANIPGIEAAIRDMKDKFPGSPTPYRIEVDLMMLLNVGVDKILPIIEDNIIVTQRDAVLMATYIKILLSFGRLVDAETVIHDLEREGADYLAMIGRWCVMQDRNGEAALYDLCRRSIEEHLWPVQKAVHIADFLFSLWSKWSAELVLSLFERVEKLSPRNIFVLCRRAQALIILCRDDEALALINSIPLHYQSFPVLELKAWADSRIGDLAAAKSRWQHIHASRYLPAFDAPQPQLELIASSQMTSNANKVTAFTVLYNELGNLPELLDHHRKIGVCRFVMVDNMSNDGTVDYLSQQPDVILYRTRDDFRTSGCGIRWINALIERHANDGWCLLIDADERFVYPGCELISIDCFANYLDLEDAEGVAAFMLDIFPERLPSLPSPLGARPQSNYYDGDFQWLGLPRAPYRRPIGGARTRLFGNKEYLHKIPLTKAGRGKYINSHETSPIRLSSVSGILLHDHLRSLVGAKKAHTRAASGMRRYKRYFSRINALMGVDLRLPGVTQELGGSFELVDQGLLHAPVSYRNWLNVAADSSSSSASAPTSSARR